jgi:hypothetical protein
MADRAVDSRGRPPVIPKDCGVDMSKERQYQEHEIRQILDLAICQEDGPAQSLPPVSFRSRSEYL